MVTTDPVVNYHPEVDADFGKLAGATEGTARKARMTGPENWQLIQYVRQLRERDRPRRPVPPEPAAPAEPKPRTGDYYRRMAAVPEPTVTVVHPVPPSDRRGLRARRRAVLRDEARRRKAH